MLASRDFRVGKFENSVLGWTLEYLLFSVGFCSQPYQLRRSFRYFHIVSASIIAVKGHFQEFNAVALNRIAKPLWGRRS
jgi:hypothetical protein